jgi:hypothetical protein
LELSAQVGLFVCSINCPTVSINLIYSHTTVRQLL